RHTRFDCDWSSDVCSSDLVRSLEAADVDPATLTPSIRRDKDELAGFLEFLVAEISHPGLAGTVQAVLADRELGAYPATAEDHHRSEERRVGKERATGVSSD